MRLGIFGSRNLSGDKVYNFIKKEIIDYSLKEKIEFLIIPAGIIGWTRFKY